MTSPDLTSLSSDAREPVPFFKPSITQNEIDAVIRCLESGWLTTGKICHQFEEEFRDYVGAKHAVAMNSATAALHLAVEALGLKRNQIVLVPSMTFAATAEVARYHGAHPLLVDSCPDTLNIDLNDAEKKIQLLRAGKLPLDAQAEVVGIIPVHYGGQMVDMDQAADFARKHGLWVVEDAAHCLPAAFRQSDSAAWKYVGNNLSDIACFSFYANKTITTGEGGMAVTNNPALADRMRSMSLHGLSHDAWKRFSGGSSWDYRIIAPGFKYNLTDIAAALGVQQLRRADQLHESRAQIVQWYNESFATFDEITVPTLLRNRIHSWHLYSVRVGHKQGVPDRNGIVDLLRGPYKIGCSVHWRPLHLHPYYEENYGWSPELFPVATREWPRLLSLPVYPGMTRQQVERVVSVLKEIYLSSPS